MNFAGRCIEAEIIESHRHCDDHSVALPGIVAKPDHPCRTILLQLNVGRQTVALACAPPFAIADDLNCIEIVARQDQILHALFTEEAHTIR